MLVVTPFITPDIGMHTTKEDQISVYPSSSQRPGSPVI